MHNKHHNGCDKGQQLLAFFDSVVVRILAYDGDFNIRYLQPMWGLLEITIIIILILLVNYNEKTNELCGCTCFDHNQFSAVC